MRRRTVAALLLACDWFVLPDFGRRATVASMAATDSSDHVPGSIREFTTTHWSVVLAASEGVSPQAAQALEKLCRVYWFPLYAHVRRQGHRAHDAQDLVQGFFAQLLFTNAEPRFHCVVWQ